MTRGTGVHEKTAPRERDGSPLREPIAPWERGHHLNTLGNPA
jgi:hypothetical protein